MLLGGAGWSGLLCHQLLTALQWAKSSVSGRLCCLALTRQGGTRESLFGRAGSRAAFGSLVKSSNLGPQPAGLTAAGWRFTGDNEPSCDGALVVLGCYLGRLALSYSGAEIAEFSGESR